MLKFEAYQPLFFIAIKTYYIMKEIIKGGFIMLKIKRKQQVETVEETKEETKMKITNWSLKKKVLVGLGVVGTAVLGVFAYGKCTENDEVQLESGNDNYDEESDDCDDEELRELEALEKAAEEAQE